MSWEQNIDEASGTERLSKTFTFKDFKKAWAFMSQVALLAEKADHHPDWTNVYSRVTIHLSTHSAGNKVTDKDRHLAEQIDALA